MKINGHLDFHTPSGAASDGQIRNAVIERIVGAGSGIGGLPATGNVKGRIVYNEDDQLYYYHNNTTWTPFSTGGDAAALQQEVDNIETTIGPMINADGTANTTNMDALTNVTGATTVSEVLVQLDAAIEGKDQLAELDDVTFTGPTVNDVIQWNGAAWVDVAIGAESGIQPLDSTLTSLAAYNSDGILVQTAADTFTARAIDASTVAGDQGISIVNGNGVGGNPTVGLDIVGLTAEAGTLSDTDVVALYDGVNNVKASVAQLKSAMVGANELNDLADVTDALGQADGLTVDDKYFFNADTVGSFEVTAATLGALNNVADGVDTATNEDVLAFDGSEWTAVTPATMAAEIDISDLGDVTVTTPSAGDVLVYGSGSPALWENKAVGSAAGVQAYDADLQAIANYDWGANPGIMVMTGAATVIDREIAVADTARLTVSNGDGVSGNPTLDLATVTDGGTGDFEKITTDTYGRVTGTTPVVTGDITALVDSTYVNVTGDAMTGNLTMGAGTDVVIPDAPVNATDAVNKAYVDGLVSAGTSWIEPVENPDFVGVADDEPTSPLASGMYIKYGGTPNETWGTVTNVVDGDMMHYVFGAWERSGNISTGDNLLVGVFTDAVDADAGEDLPSFLYRDDYVRYVSGDPDLAAAWDFPYGRSPNHPGFTATGDGTDTITISGSDETASFKAGNLVSFDGNEFTIVSVTFGTDTDIVVSGNPGSATTTVSALLRDGGTTTDLNSNDSHYGDTYIYSAADSQWIAIAGPGSIEAGTGLSYSGTVLNVNLGAGIVELPTDEVGLDIESGKAVQLTSTATGGLLTFILDGTTLSQSASGLKVDAAGITETELNASIAGAGLSGGAGTPLAVNVDDSSLEINVDTLRVKALGITNAMLFNDHYTIATNDTGADQDVQLGDTLNFNNSGAITVDISTADTVTIGVDTASETVAGVATFDGQDFTVTGGDVVIAAGGVNLAQINADANHVGIAGDTGSTDVSLGSDITIAGGTLTTTTESAGTVTIDVAADTSDLGDVTAAPTESGQVMVSTGTSYTPDHISYVHTQSTSGTTWTVSHSLNQKFVNVTVYDNNDDVVIPQSITATDANTTTVTFNTALTGTVVVMGVSGSATGSA
jgi:hypothetical protein